MAHLSSLAQLYLKIADNLSSDDVRKLKALLVHDEILGIAKVEHAEPIEIFTMLKNDMIIGEGNLGLLVHILRSLGKRRLAEEAERLEQAQQTEGSKPQDKSVTGQPEEKGPEDSASDDSGEEYSTPRSSTPENTEEKEAIGASASTAASGDDIEKQQLASLHIKELARLTDEPKTTAPGPQSGPNSSTDERDAEVKLSSLQAELNTDVVKGDKEKQFDLCCQIGDLYRTKLHNLQAALVYYQNMLECSESLAGDPNSSKTYNRLGITYDILGEQQEAVRSHEKTLKIYKATENNEICVAYKNLASSFQLSGKVSDAKDNYKSALAAARKAGNKPEEMDIYCKLGDLYRKQLNNPHVSHKYYTKVLSLARDMGKTYWEMLAYNRLGVVCQNMQDYELALEWNRTALKMSLSDGDEKDQIQGHVNVGDAYRNLGNKEQATFHFETALQMAQQTEDRYGQMQVYVGMGDLQREQLHSPRTAIQYYEQALALARELGDRNQEGVAYNRLGHAQFDMGEYEAALEGYQRVLKIQEHVDDKKALFIQYLTVGNAYRFLGKLDQATSHLNSALQLAQQTGDQQGQMQVYFSIGEMQKDQLHSPRTAIQYYEQYLALARQLGDRGKEGVANNKLGRAHYVMGEYEAALEWYEKHLKISKERDDKKEEVRAHTDVGDAYRCLGKIEQALSYFDTALQIAQQTEDLHGQMIVYLKMGDMQRKQLHSPRTAIQYYEQYLALATRLGNRGEEGAAYNRLGRAHFAMEEYEAALEWDKKDLKIRQETGDKANLLITHNCIADSYKALRKLDLAKSHYQSSMTIAKETGNMQQQMEINLWLGDLHRKELHEPQVSHEYYAMMLTLARDMENKDKGRLAYNRLGRVHYEIGEYAAALDWDKKDLKMSQENGDKTAQVTAHKNIAASYQALDKSDLARSHYESAMTLAKETGNKQEQEVIAKRMKGLQTCIVS
uniref:DED domain-containing protein n=1 Tax=Branchiostoma floridae TaxID=7739 RepID=C3ZRM3_BRAFL|eukprot:XP_002588812.1 hypothetical protein BRAFLDRAFT_89757 [Branchiostoma floridae]